jgi:hypothetical protein
MRIIKLGIISFVVLFVIVTLISFLLPSHIRISKAINLPNKKDSILSLIANQDQWPRWHPAYANSTSAKEMAIIKKTYPEQTDSTYVIQLQLADRKPVVNGWQVFGSPTSDSLTLQWYMDFKLGWLPWQKFSSLFFEPTYGSLMQKGLTNIKMLLEK